MALLLVISSPSGIRADTNGQFVSLLIYALMLPLLLLTFGMQERNRKSFPYLKITRLHSDFTFVKPKVFGFPHMIKQKFLSVGVLFFSTDINGLKVRHPGLVPKDCRSGFSVPPAFFAKIRRGTVVTL